MDRKRTHAAEDRLTEAFISFTDSLRRALNAFEEAERIRAAKHEAEIAYFNRRYPDPK